MLRIPNANIKDALVNQTLLYLGRDLHTVLNTNYKTW